MPTPFYGEFSQNADTAKPARVVTVSHDMYSAGSSKHGQAQNGVLKTQSLQRGCEGVVREKKGQSQMVHSAESSNETPAK